MMMVNIFLILLDIFPVGLADVILIKYVTGHQL
jgi:hypothetical protein